MSSLESYVGNPLAFPVLRHWDFFNHAGVAPICGAAAEAMRTFAAEAERGAYLETRWYKDIESLRQSAAAMIGAHRDEIAFIKNTSEGIATVAGGIDWRAGDRIVTSAVEYPANMYPWMDIAKRFGVELITVAEVSEQGGRIVPIDRILAEAAHPRTRLVALSHVEFGSGQRIDIAPIGKFCRENGKLFSVDAIQSLGVLPVNVVEMNIDYLSADGHKWLLGPEGAGIFYCRRELLESTRPLIVGWLNVLHAQDFGKYDFTFKKDAGKFECGSYNVPGLLGLKAAVELLTTAGIDAIAGRMKMLTDSLIAGLQAKGYDIVSPRTGEQWSSSVCFTSDRHDQAKLQHKLRTEHRIEIAERVNRLRVSAHFYNMQEQIDRLVEVLPGH